MIFITWLIGRPLKLDPVEKASLIYSNAGNLIIPIVTSVLGPEWVIYTSGFISVQVILIWTHCKMLLCGEKKADLKKIVTNINMIACCIGIIMFLTKIRFPYPVQDAVDTMGSMIGAGVHGGDRYADRKHQLGEDFVLPQIVAGGGAASCGGTRCLRWRC